jgi:putative heme-binding domain-containing protein
LILAAGARAQHESMSSNVLEGERRYMASCAACHGADGRAITEADLSQGKFRRASSDQEIVALIRNGIPGTAMPPNSISEGRASTIVAYLRFIASERSALTGDAARGRAIFEGKGGCLGCHRVHGKGSRLGPDLSEVGMQRRAAELERSLLDPSAEIAPRNRIVRIVTQDGATITARLLNHDAFSAQVLDAKQGLLSFDKAKLREFSFVEQSPMPSFRGKLSEQEVADVVRYLATLRGIDSL